MFTGTNCFSSALRCRPVAHEFRHSNASLRLETNSLLRKAQQPFGEVFKMAGIELLAPRKANIMIGSQGGRVLAGRELKLRQSRAIRYYACTFLHTVEILVVLSQISAIIPIPTNGMMAAIRNKKLFKIFLCCLVVPVPTAKVP